MKRRPSITDVPGVSVGHWTDQEAKTGTTVVTFPPKNIGAGEIRGGYPGAREFETLCCAVNSAAVDAVVFSGGSAFGLAAAEGVMAVMAEDGRGSLMSVGVHIPLVPSAVVFDLAVGDPTAYPGPEEGRTAYLNRQADAIGTGRVGAGVGTTVGKWRGEAATSPGGVGTSSIRVGEATVGVLAVVNAVGDVFSLEGESLTGGSCIPELFPQSAFGDRENTTLVALATDAKLTRPELLRVLVRVHDALGACLRPAHTRWDGDAAVAVSTGDIVVNLDSLAEAAFIATGRAIESSVDHH